ncbi:MAG: hypothetical protein Q9207_008234 [Kuettlingeria erythrocarpa]
MLGILPPWRTRYEKITSTTALNEKAPFPEDGTRKKPLHERKAFLIPALVLLIIFLLVVISLAAYRVPVSSHASPPTPASSLPDHPTSHLRTPLTETAPPHHPCGTSSAEAIALNCTFDQLMWAWYPLHCPHYANDAFAAAALDDGAPWRFYLDPKKQVPADGENWRRVLDNEVDGVYGERREHLSHCVYMFLGVGMVLKERDEGGEGRATARAVDYEHLVHCAGVLMEGLRHGAETERGWWDVQTKAPRVFYDQDC